MIIHRPPIQGLAVIEPNVYADERGFFFELFNSPFLQSEGIDIKVVQTNVSKSTQGVLRGLHYQWPNPQGKLVTCLQGEVWDVAVDIRQDSPTFGQYHAEILSEQNHKSFWIPAGFAHGFLTLSEEALFVYHVDAPYDQPNDRGIHHADPTIKVPWPHTARTPILSPKDQALPQLNQVQPQHLPKL